ncbi:MAG TPA: hypothetical protein VF662_15615 [Allosphingosinicella sp.]
MPDARLREVGPALWPAGYQGETKMRVLSQNELVHVTGAGGSSGCYTPPPPSYCPPSPPSCPPSKSKSKGNNGYGNGGGDGVPGRSGKQDYNR